MTRFAMVALVILSLPPWCAAKGQAASPAPPVAMIFRSADSAPPSAMAWLDPWLMAPLTQGKPKPSPRELYRFLLERGI